MNKKNIAVFVVALVATAKCTHESKREVPNIELCNPPYSQNNLVQCFCVPEKHHSEIKTAECYLTSKNVSSNHKTWGLFKELRMVQRLGLTATRGIAFTFVPTFAITYLEAVKKIDIQNGNIHKITSDAFANQSSVEEILLSDNQIEVLEKYAFSNLKSLNKINLDTNNLNEINRDVFYGLPALESLYLTLNKITTIHDKAFIHLHNLKELELDKNKIFSLNSETFAGLQHLTKLELSKNALEVIGDNTFLPLKNLQYLNLGGNKIQMLDDLAFNGLFNLQSLSLSGNKLISIDNDKVFSPMKSLSSLGLRGNHLKEIRLAVMKPILEHFYKPASTLDLDENYFPCDCRLDWLLDLKNKTKNEGLKLSLENLKCLPSQKLKDIWEKVIENEKTSGASFEESKQTDYEYYDDSQLNGNLFYIDIREYINCSESVVSPVTQKTSPQTKATATATAKPIKMNVTTFTETLKPVSVQTTSKNNKYTTTKFKNKGVLDLSLEQTTINDTNEEIVTEKTTITVKLNKETSVQSTTVPISTVSAKPTKVKYIEQKLYEEKEMAADEAAPNQVPYNAIIQDFKSNLASNSANENTFKIVLIIIPIYFRLL